MKRWVWLIGLSFLVSLSGLDCERREKPPTVVAKVGGNVLTLEEVNEQIPPDYYGVVTREQKEELVRRWIDTEVLYHEALRRGLHKEEKIKRMIKRMKTELLAAELVERELNDNTAVTDEELESYYSSHKEEFARDHPEVRAKHLLVGTRKEAWKVRRRLVRGESFEDLLKEGPIEGGDLGYFSMDDVPSEIAKVAFSLREGEISKPVKTDLGYHIIQVLDSEGEGTLRPLKMVKGEIVDKLATIKQRKHLEELLKRLKKKEVIEVHLEVLSTREEPDSLR